MQRYRKINVTDIEFSTTVRADDTNTDTYIYVYIYTNTCVCVYIYRSLSTEMKPKKDDSDIEIYNVLIYKRRNGGKETD